MTSAFKGGKIQDIKTFNMGKFVAWQVASLMKNKQQSQNLLLEVDPCSTFCNNFLEPKTNVCIAWQVDHTRWKTTIKLNLQQNNFARQVEGFCILCLPPQAADKQVCCRFLTIDWNGHRKFSCYSISPRNSFMAMRTVLVYIR